MDRPLQVLMVLHMPWDRNLGAPRVQIELAEELRSRGHEVDRYAWSDAFPRPRRERIRRVVGPTFAARAGRFVKSVAPRYDIIDAQHGDLPFAKTELGFQGLLVARSCGLYRFYYDFESYSRRRWPTDQGRLAGRVFRRWEAWRDAAHGHRSLVEADLVTVPNRDELSHVRDELGMGDKCVYIPNGLEASRFAALNAAAAAGADRLASPEVTFIGWWSLRKGARDWQAIAAHIRRELPNTRLTFLGTGQSQAAVLEALGISSANGVRVVPYYASEDLPGLLRHTTVGALPSYVEGFGLGVLEQMAAGIPTVAYDAPGPRETLGQVERTLLTPLGDPHAFAERVVGLLRSDAAKYAALSSRCKDVARGYSVDQITRATVDVYRERLADLS